MEYVKGVKYNSDGLVPAIAQDVVTGEVLMQAYMNEESLRLTLETGYAYYYSRSRQALWKKGETSGNLQKVASVALDCDKDCVLLKVVQTGPACHTGERSCFFNIVKTNAEAPNASILYELRDVIADRRAHPQEGSYTNYLFDKGIDKILKKVGEESAEVIIASKNEGNAELRYEAADLIYPLLVLLNEKQLPLEELFQEVHDRF